MYMTPACYTVIKWFTSTTSIGRIVFASTIHTCFWTVSQKILHRLASKGGCCDNGYLSYDSHTKVRSSITWWYSYIDGTPRGSNMISTDYCRPEDKASFQQGTIRNNPFVTVTTDHLISDLDLYVFDDVNTIKHVNTWLQFITIARVKDF